MEASGTPQARTISMQWHATFRLPVKVAEPLRLTTYAYDSAGNLLTKTEQATTDATGTPRTWSYTYNQYGQVLTVTNPLGKTTTNAYDSQGNLTSVTNALGQKTTLSNYDANGRVGTITDPNGLVTSLTYSPRGWLTSQTVGGETTSFSYDGVGQRTQITLPDGTSINYGYDAAHRLTDVTDSLGNSIHYTLDAMGNRIKEEARDPDGALARQTTRVYDALNRLQQVTGAQP